MFNKFSSVFKKSADIKAKLKDFGSSLTSVTTSNIVASSVTANGAVAAATSYSTKEITK